MVKSGLSMGKNGIPPVIKPLFVLLHVTGRPVMGYNINVDLNLNRRVTMSTGGYGSKILLALIAFLALSISLFAGGNNPDNSGIRFIMVMDVPGQDTVEFDGRVLRDNCRLEGLVGRIESVILLTGGDLFVLTPAIKTAREIDNPGIPGNDSTTWSEWLIEPGRINPLNFGESLGVSDEGNESLQVGSSGQIDLNFENGILKSVRFANPDGEGEVIYTYRDFESDSDIKHRDFEIPDDYLMTE
jgi:hypothetical protein